jgi:hypothetical protein
MKSLIQRPDPGKYNIHLRICILFIFIALLVSSCGYTNPYVSRDSNKVNKLFMTTWQNRTNELGLESVYFRIFNSWFKKSGIVNIHFNEAESDLKLYGEISSIDLPGLFYDTFDEALEVKIKLTVSFTLTETRTKKILWQEKNYTVYEPFLLDPSGEQTEQFKQRALIHIGEELGELIYMKIHEIVSQLP